MNTRIAETLKAADNEGTESPYWLVIDPKGVGQQIAAAAKHGEVYDQDQVLSTIAFSIDGPFFSREDAEAYLKSRSYDYSPQTQVWCASGYRSQKYKEFCRELRSPAREIN